MTSLIFFSRYELSFILNLLLALVLRISRLLVCSRGVLVERRALITLMKRVDGRVRVTVLIIPLSRLQYMSENLAEEGPTTAENGCLEGGGYKTF